MLRERLKIIKTLLDHDDISLHALNAPQRAIRGVTPLGFAAWLNIPSAVRLLLETYPGLVSVDGMDSLGATALMCTFPLSSLSNLSNLECLELTYVFLSITDAARDGNVQVVQHLVSSLCSARLCVR